MIPTMMVFGLVLGRWWKSALIAAAIFWPVLLVVTRVLPSGSDVGPFLVDVLLASGLAAANAAVGVGIHQLVLYVFRRVRSKSANRSEA